MHFIRCLILVVIFVSPPPLRASEQGSARITTSFPTQPAPIHLSGQGQIFNGVGIPIPANFTGVLMLQPPDGQSQTSFPAVYGDTALSIPAHNLEFFPTFPGMIMTSQGPLTPLSMSHGTTTPFTANFPAMTASLPSPLPEGVSHSSSFLSSPLLLKINLPIGFHIQAMSSQGFPVTLFPNNPIATIPLLPVTSLNFEVVIPEQEPEIYQATLAYSVHLVSDSPGAPYSWDIAGNWAFTITHDAGGTSTAELAHSRTQNNYSGSLTHVTDPALPDLPPLSATSYGIPPTAPDDEQGFYIQFSKQQFNIQHVMTFVHPQAPGPREQEFSNVAMIALGQWMRIYGDPTLRCRALLTPAAPISWSVPIAAGSSIQLQWSMHKVEEVD